MYKMPSRNTLKTAQNSIKRNFRRRNRYWKKTYNDLFDASANARQGESWRLINQISGRKAGKKCIPKGSSTEDRFQKWRSYFSNLLGKVPVIEGEIEEEIQAVLDPLDIYDGLFTADEYKNVKKNLTGEITRSRCDLDDIILSYANNLIENGLKPEQWSTVDIIPLPKKVTLDVPGHYRGIGLSSLPAKITNKIILNRIQPVLDQHLRPNHILALRRLIEGVKSNGLKSIIIFVDFKKAFDSIHHGKMEKILVAYGILEKLVAAIMKLYEGTKAKAVSPDGDTALFDIKAGVLQ